MRNHYGLAVFTLLCILMSLAQAMAEETAEQPAIEQEAQPVQEDVLITSVGRIMVELAPNAPPKTFRNLTGVALDIEEPTPESKE